MAGRVVLVCDGLQYAKVIQTHRVICDRNVVGSDISLADVLIFYDNYGSFFSSKFCGLFWWRDFFI